MDWGVYAPLRAWQEEALRTWVLNGFRGVVSVVTGAGKTLFAEACMSSWSKDQANPHVIVVVPTLALMDQWHVSLVDDMGASPDQVATYSGEGIPTSPKALNLIVLNTARYHAPRISKTYKCLLIVDECHRAASPINSSALAGDHVATLGLSATPQRDYDDLFETNVVPALGTVIYQYGHERALADGVISPFKLVNVRFNLSPAEQENYEALTHRIRIALRRRDNGEALDDRLQRLLRDRARVSNRARIRIPLAVRIAELHRSERIIVFHEEISSAETIARLLRDRGRRAAAYHSRLGPELRRDNLRQFRRGQVDVLVTCRALDEGVNVPDASVAIIASGTASTRQRIQRLGRVLRPYPGKDQAAVYTLFATDPEEQRLRKEETDLEGTSGVDWLSAEVS